MKKYNELKKRNLAFKSEPNLKERFIRMYGVVNCKYLTFKSANNVINELMKANDDPLEKEAKEFIVKQSHKEVLCYVMQPNGNTDIFVFGDDNIPFNTECFV